MLIAINYSLLIIIIVLIWKIKVQKKQKQKNTLLLHEIRNTIHGIFPLFDKLSKLTIAENEKEQILAPLSKGLHQIQALLSSQDLSFEIQTIDSQKLIDYFKSQLSSLCPEHLESTFFHNVEVAFFQSNEKRIIQIFHNFLTNAIKFTPEGSIDIKVAITAQTFRIDIKDTGIGIPKEKQNKIFNMGYKLNATAIGDGAGLFISQKIAKELGGDIHIRSAEGKGTHISFNLLLNKTNVLIIDDNALALEASTMIISSLGHKVETATDLNEALLILKYKRINYVLVDYHLENMKGSELALNLLKQHPNLKIFALTGDSNPAIKQACLNVGIQDVLEKPINKQRLLESLNH